MLNSKTVKILVTATAGIILSWVLLLSLSFYDKNPVFTIALPVMLILVFALLLNPEAVLAVILCTRTLLDPFLELTKMDFAGQNIGIGAGVNMVIIILALIFFIRERNKAMFLRQNIIWLIFLFIMGSSLIYSVEKGNGLRFFFNLVSYFCMFLMPFLIVKDANRQRFWEKILLISVVVTVIAADIDMLKGGHFYIDAGHRVGGTFSHPNILGFYLILAIAIIFYIKKRDQALKHEIPPAIPSWAGRLLMINLFILLLASLTRNAWIACWMFFFIYGLLEDRKILIVLFVFSFIALLLPFARERILDLSSSHFRYYQGADSWSWRIALWDSAVPWILRRPFFGYGLSSFFSLSPHFFGGEKGVDAHSAYIQILFETGIFGLAGYCVLYFNILRRIWQAKKIAEKTLKAACLVVFSYLISYLIINIADNILFYLSFNWYFWFFIGLFLASFDLRKPHPESA